MQRIVVLSLVAAVLIGTARARAAGQKDTESPEEIRKEVLKFEDERNAAILKHDTATLNRMYADEITWTMSNGDLLNKSQVLANIGSGNQLLSTIQHHNRTLHVYGDTVVLTATSSSKERYRGNNITVPRRFTNVYVKRGGQWQLIVHTVTPLAGYDASSLPPAETK
jgi:ketosteroid isomerase-like protein